MENKKTVQIMEIDEIKLKGVSRQFTGNAANRFEQEHNIWSNEQDDVQSQVCATIPGVCYGIWNKGVYSIAKKDTELDNSNLEIIKIPSGKYAVFSTAFGGYAGDELPKLHEYIFGNWLPNSSYKQIGDYEVEVYHLYPKSEKYKRHYEIWIPIE